MRIAVTCDESGSMSGYFGKSTLLYLAEAEAGRIVARISRPVGPGGLSAANLDELHDCDSVVCKGIGPGSAEALRARGITPYVVDRPMEPDEAVLALLDGRLKPSGMYDAGAGVRSSRGPLSRVRHR